MRFTSQLLAGAAFALPVSTPLAAAAQDAPAAATDAQPQAVAAQPAAQPEAEAATDEYDDEDAIVITGARLPGSVVGDIPPEKTFDARDVRATGATNINELLEALAPEIGSARGRGGGAPVVLLNGQRVSGFRELRDIPAEAIQRVEVLPEEVALKYGYRADQRVVNVVTRRRFRSTAVEARANATTDGGYAGGVGDLTRLLINRSSRTTLNLHGEANGMLTEAERDIESEASDGSARSLIGSRRQIRGTATFNRPIGDVSATLNTELQHVEGRSLIGLGETLLEPLARNSDSNSAHAGVTLNWERADWRWNVTGNADLERSVTRTERDDELADDRARSTRASGDVEGMAQGNLFKLPAGDASTTISIGASTVNLDSGRRRAGVTTGTDLGRTRGDAAINLDLPVSRRNRDFSALGNLTLNANAEIEQLSDFGTLTTIGAGANWSPVERLNLITSWTREEGAPSIQQLGDPILETPDARIFDFTTGETVLVNAITGGNPDLLADRRNVFKIGGNWQPWEKVDLRLRADFVSSRIRNPISSISVTPAIEEAFPERFVRNASDDLVSVDLRPVNFASARQDTLRLGFSFSKPLKSRRPSQAVIDQFRAQFGGGRRGAGDAPAGPPREAGPPPEGGPRREGGAEFGRGEGRGFGGGGRFGGGGGPFGGGNRGRLQFSLTDTITLTDRVTIRSGVPELDYLDGEAVGQTGGRPRHQVEARAGWFNNGLGARASLDWRSGTRVESLTGDDLKFSPYATFDLRLFANLGEQFELVQKHPWLRGSSVRLQIDNLFNSRPKVRDASGNTPLNYQPDLLEPLGRTVMISFRKLFSPSPAAFRRMRQQERATGGDED